MLKFISKVVPIQNSIGLRRVQTKGQNENPPDNEVGKE